MRTGSVGNRTVEDMIRTLPEPKKSAISSMRERLLSQGYYEEIEYDPIEIEPIIIFSGTKAPKVLLKHKWRTVVCISIAAQGNRKALLDRFPDLAASDFRTSDEDQTLWLDLELPAKQMLALEALAFLSAQ